MEPRWYLLRGPYSRFPRTQSSESTLPGRCHAVCVRTPGPKGKAVGKVCSSRLGEGGNGLEVRPPHPGTELLGDPETVMGTFV